MKKIRQFISKIRQHWKRTLVIVIVLVVAFFIYKKVTAEPVGITSTTISRATLVNDFSANGEIKAKKMANLKFYSPGKVTWIGVENGDQIRAWQGVASLDAVALNAAYQQALNNYRNYQATADEVLDSVKDHSGDETFTQKADRTTAEVNRDNAYDAMLAAQSNLKNAVLVSPIAGTVIDTNDLIAGINLTGSDLEAKTIKVVDLSSLYFEAQIDEIDFSKVKVGQEVTVNVDAYPGESCTGIVSFVGKDGQKTTGGVITIPAEILFSDCSLEYAIGLNGQAHFVISKTPDALIIPKKYIFNKDGKSYVWKQNGSSTKNRSLVEVTIGITSSTEAEILAGLSEGDTIIFIP